MRSPIVPAVLAGLLLTPGLVQAQKPQKTRITDVRVGYRAGMDPGDPMGKRLYLFKPGMWTPVSVDVIAGDDGLSGGRLTVETTDSDDVQNVYTIPMPALQPREPFTVLTYTKTGSTGPEIVVSVYDERQKPPVDELKRVYEAMELDDMLFLAVGGNLTGLKQALLATAQQPAGPAKPGQPPPNAPDSTKGSVSYLNNVQMLSTRWFAYEPVDLVVLTTGSVDFVTDLINPQHKARQDALSEWVRRGGRLVISTGRNHDLAPALLEALRMNTLPVSVAPGAMQLPRLDKVELWSSVAGQHRLEAQPAKPGEKAPPVEVARLQVRPGQDVEVLIGPPDNGPPEAKSHPLMVRAPYGLGQVTLVAFDLDLPPFRHWGGQAEFWKKLQDETDTRLVVRQGNQNNYGPYGRMNADHELASSLRTSLENFPDVSNISFGWVALFIFLYILVVGPLDYFFLKKVVKRLELTWITFPTVVLVVSAVAYFTAYTLKGNDLLINKVDLVNFDLDGKSVYGQSWFTLFSPRIQHYTVGIEPASGAWSAAPAAEQKDPSVVLSWMGRPDTTYGGYGRARSTSLFRRAYQYAPDAAGLEGVPIQVWSMKSFVGNWARPLDPAKPPLTAELQHAEGTNIKGKLTNNLPVPLHDVALLHYGSGGNRKVVPLKETLEPGVAVEVDLGVGAEDVTTWAQPVLTGNTNTYGPRAPTAVALDKDQIFRRIIIHGVVSAGSQEQNVALRDLDESWRLRLKNEVMLFARVVHKTGPAEDVTEGLESPTRLWLGELPRAGVRRPALLGTLSQDTYVRVFLPVRPAEAEKP